MANPDDPKTKHDDFRAELPPRLRSKYSDADNDEESRSRNVQNLVALVMLVLVVGLGSVLMVLMAKGKEEAKRKAAEEARAAAASHLADSLRTRMEDSLRAARADSLAKFAPKTPPTPTAGTPAGSALTGAASATPAAPPPEPTHYGIAVGTFLTQDRANQEQTKLAGSTSLSGAVSEVTQDNVTQYRVIIGDFTDKKEAEKKANELIVAASVREARVVKLPKK